VANPQYQRADRQDRSAQDEVLRDDGFDVGVPPVPHGSRLGMDDCLYYLHEGVSVEPRADGGKARRELFSADNDTGGVSPG
jgi:hypothetical protein